MRREGLTAVLMGRFRKDIIAVQEKSPTRVYVEIRPEAIVRVANYLFKDLGARFNIASGLDTSSHLEVLYHFTLEDYNLLVSVRVRLSKEHPVIASLAPSFEGANWVEREMHEMLGIGFIGHPNLTRLLLPEDWPEGVFPLRRDYEEWDSEAVRDRGV